MKKLLILILLISAPFATYFGLIAVSESLANFLLWMEEDVRNNPNPWYFFGTVLAAALALSLLWLFDWIESVRKVPDYQISMAKHRAESLIKF